MSKVNKLAEDYVGGKIDRREFIRRTAKLGVGLVAAGSAVSLAGSNLLAAGVDFKKYKGKKINLLLNKHPYTDALIKNLDTFKRLTGIKVSYDVFPEDVYFDKVTASLSSRSKKYDVFMTGIYQTWQYGPAGWLVDLNKYIKDTSKTSPNYAWDDVLSGIKDSCAWSGKVGDDLGGANAKQWCLPWAFELNSVTYNKRLFKKHRMSPPNNLPELMDKANYFSRKVKDVYGIGVRGSRSWATIHPGYLSGLVNYGGSDFVMKNNKLMSNVNSKECKEFTKLWIDMVKKSGPKNWTTYTWYQVGADLGAGASAMIFDADILGYFSNGEGNKEKGNLAFKDFAANPRAKKPTPNIWTWSLAMSNFSKQKDPAWLFMQWATAYENTTFGAVNADMINPVRKSVWARKDFKSKMSRTAAGYLDQFEASEKGSKVYFTPQPLFFSATTEWASALQKMYAGEVSVSEGLEQLALKVNKQLRDIDL